MNWIDNLVGIFSPERAAKRQAWRQTLDELRHYDAGNYDRLNTNWTAFNQSAENTDRYERDVVRARARDLERNSDIANGVIGAFRRNVVGHGRTLQARTPDETLNDRIEELWRDWCKRKNCDVTEQQNFNELLRMTVTRKKVDGGILFRKCTVPGKYNFKLQALEVDEIDASQTEPKNKDCKVVNGIEYNSYNKPMGYWIKQYALDGYCLTEPEYVPANKMIFVYTKRRPSQIREMSDMSQTLTRVRDTNEFMTAVSVKERVMACFSVFIKKVTPSGIGRGTGTAPNKSYDGKTITPGMIKELNAGDDIQVVNPTGQSQDAATYIKLQQRLIGAGQGLSYETTSRDMSQVNYSSARQGAIEDQETYIEDKELIEEVFMDDVYESFIEACVLNGLINAPDYHTHKEAYLKHEWVEAPKKWIDPLKEVNANKVALQTGQKTFKQIAAENGRDWKEQLDEMADIMEYGKSKGIDLGGMIYGQVQAPATNESV